MPNIGEADFKKILSRGDFGTLYYLCGDEKLLVSHYTEKLIAKTAGKKPDEFNYHEFTGVINVDEFEAAAQMIPFTADYNVVVVKDLDMTALKPNEASKLLDTVSHVAGDTIIIFTFPTKPDKNENGKASGGAKDAKLKELVQKKGTVVEYKKLTAAAVKTKLSAWASKRGVVLSPKSADMLIEYVGVDLNRLRMELSKLCSYCGDNGEITEDIVDMLVTRDLESRIYDLSNAVINNKAAQAFRVLDTLLYNREDELRIMAALASSYVNIYRVRMAIKSGARTAELKKWFKYSDAQLRYAERDSRASTTAALRRSINAIAETDIAMKSTRTSKRLLLEILIQKLLMISSEERRR
ncbi:MAG: DNA polymerase III subunit delta [Clostridia bacterium]|nr:DNA polymerase III subunit delta [Clostridia bacterium]